MITVLKTDKSSPDFLALVKLLDADLAFRDGDEHEFFAQFNHTASIPWAMVAYENGIPAGCGGIKPYSEGVAEVKRMFTHPNARRKGVGSLVLSSLEKWAKDLGFQKCILETSVRQPEAIAMYYKAGYSSIPNYGQYEGVEGSVCFEKELL